MEFVFPEPESSWQEGMTSNEKWVSDSEDNKALEIVIFQKTVATHLCCSLLRLGIDDECSFLFAIRFVSENKKMIIDYLEGKAKRGAIKAKHEKAKRTLEADVWKWLNKIGQLDDKGLKQLLKEQKEETKGPLFMV